jgi:myo-inositol-1(or 4)-monophosphatase
MLEEVIKISREVGLFLKSQQQLITKSEIEFKGRVSDMVSRADKEAEVMFVNFLAALLPEAGFIAEEGTSTKKGDEYNWIIDPLDGTTNYLYNMPVYCTSVALMKNDELVLGVIYDPSHDECFAAAKGQGATLNGQPISVSNEKELGNSLLATGFPYDDKGRLREFLNILADINESTRGIRRLGSAALDLAYVACGRLEGFYEYGLQPWDCAAGALIVCEAGGAVSDFKGGNDYVFGRTLICSNSHIQIPLQDFFKNW